MNDLHTGWLLQQIEGSVELLGKQLAAVEKIDPERFQRLVKVTMHLSSLCKQHQSKTS